MQQISNIIKIPEKSKTPHELSACVDEIVNISPLTKTYNFKYWLSKVKKSGLSYGQILEIVKKAGELPDKYNKGGYISNQLKT